MKNILLTFLFVGLSLVGFAQNDFSVDATFAYTENTDFDGRYLEHLTDGSVALIDTNQVTVIDPMGTVTFNYTVPSGYQYVDQAGVDQMSTFFDATIGVDCAVFYNDSEFLKVDLSTGAATTKVVNAAIGDLTFEVEQVTHAFESYYLVSYLMYDNLVYAGKTVGLINVRGTSMANIYASDIFENLVAGGLGDYDRIVHLGTDDDLSDSFMVIDNDQVTHKIDYSFPDVEFLNFNDPYVVTVDNVFATNFNALGMTNLEAAYLLGDDRFIVFGDMNSEQFTVIEPDGTQYSSFNFPPYLINSQATITDADVYDSSAGTFDFDPTNTHAIALTFQANNFLSPAPYGLSVFDAQGCPWQFFANDTDGSCVFNSEGFAGEGLNLNGDAYGVHFSDNGQIYVSGSDFETFNQDGANTVFRLGGFAAGSVYILGCTDVLAANWNPMATFDDGSCDFSAFNMICYASVEPDSTVTVNWAEGTTEFSHFEIYRESGEAGVFDLVSTIEDVGDVVRSYNDVGVNAFVQEHRYKIIGLLTASDTTSSNTPRENLSLVAERGTIKLNSLPDIDNQIVLTWNAPANTPLSSYFIVETDTETIIDTVSANVLSYTVINPSPSGDYFISFTAPDCTDGNANFGDGGGQNLMAMATQSRQQNPLIRSNADNVVRGCTYEDAENYNPEATADDGSCILDCVDDCPTDTNDDGKTDIQDVLNILGTFGTYCDGTVIGARNQEVIEQMIVSLLDEIVFTNQEVKFNQDVDYQIYNLSGQIVKRGYTNYINLNDLSSGMYIFVIGEDARRFTISR